MSTRRVGYAEILARLDGDWQQIGATSLAGIVVLVALYAILYARFVDPPTALSRPLQRVLSAFQKMASRAYIALSKAPSGPLGHVLSGPTSPLQRLFGLDPAQLLKTPQGDVQRSFATLRTSKDSDSPAGLGNWDNSCYQNSIIQGLASISALPPFLRSVTNWLHGNSANTTIAALLATVDNLNDSSNNGRYLWLPSKLKSMSTWQQQDAQEYYSKVLDQIDKEAHVALSSQSQSSGLAWASDGSIGQHTSGMFSKTQPALGQLHNPLEGLIAQRVSCTGCGFSDGLSLIPFNCLTVSLGESWRTDIHIEDCIAKFTELEFIEGVECAKCTLLESKSQLVRFSKSTSSEQVIGMIDHRIQMIDQALEQEDFSDSTLAKRCQIPKKNWISSTKTKQAVIARAPKALVVHVNRSIFNESTGAQMKNASPVRFDSDLNLRQWCLGTTTQSGQVEMEGWTMKPLESMLPPPSDTRCLPPYHYSLRAVITHRGSHENGHYVCFRKHHSKNWNLSNSQAQELKGHHTPMRHEEWWRLSDETVMSVDEETALAQGGVFMLFYERIEDDAPFRADNVGAAENIDPAAVPLPDDAETLEEEESISPTTEPSYVETATSQLIPQGAAELDGTQLDHVSNDLSVHTVGGTDTKDVCACSPEPELLTNLESQARKYEYSPSRSPILMRTAGVGKKEHKGTFTSALPMVAAL